MGSWGIVQVVIGLGCFGLLIWFGLGGVAATCAHDLGSFAAMGDACIIVDTVFG